MFTEKGIYPIGDGLLDVDAERLKDLLVVSHDINEIYEVEQTPFARGKFAAVRRAIHKNSGLHFAAKFLKRRRRAQSSDKEIKHEIAVLMLCEGEDNIVNLNAVHETRSDTALLLELATGGELQTILDNEECLSEAHARHCMREVLKALKFLHDRSIAHLDLKPQNILLSGERIEDGLKLCDFGISRVVCEGINVREMAGTPDYVAPEVLQYEPLSLLTDIWSVGVLAYVLLSGFSPFGGDTKQETFLNISQCALTFPDNLFGGVSPAAIDFIRRALRIKPNDRMNAAGCLEHIWLKDECSLDRQIFLSSQTANQTDFPDPDEDVDEEDDEDDEEDEDEAEEELVESQPEQTEAELENKSGQQNGEKASTQLTGSKVTTHNGYASKIPIAATKYSSNGSGSPTKLSPTATETTTAIHTLPCLTLATTTGKPTQIVTPTRRASDSDKENTYTTTFVKKPAKSIASNGAGAGVAGVASPTILVVGETSVVATVATLPANGTACLFPDAPTTPKVIRKAPSAEVPATSVKALVKKFQLENGSSSSNGHETDSAHTLTLNPLPQTLSLVVAKGVRKCSVPTVMTATATAAAATTTGMRRSCSNNGSTTSSHSSSNGSVFGGRRASEPLTGVHKKQQQQQQQQQLQLQQLNGGSNCSSSSSSNNSSANSTPGTSNGSTTALLLNGHHLHHHHMHHHHHHHHHHHVVKSAAAPATNNLSLDQGIIC